MREIYFGPLIALSIIGAGFALGSELPKPNGHVNDIDHILTLDQVHTLENKVMDIENHVSDHPQIAVLLIKHLPDDEDINSYKNKIFHAWGIGQKSKDNGILLVLSQLDRNVGIEVGYGLEPRIPDAEAHVIVNENIKPNLKRGSENWYKAIDDTIDHIGKDLKDSSEPVTPVTNSSHFIPIVSLFVVGGVILLLFWRRRVKSKEKIRHNEILRSTYQTRTSRPVSPPYSPPYRSEIPNTTKQDSPIGPAVIGAAAGIAAGEAASSARRRQEERRRKDNSSSSSSSYDDSSSSSPSSSSTDSSSSSFGGGDSGGGGTSDSF